MKLQNLLESGTISQDTMNEILRIYEQNKKLKKAFACKIKDVYHGHYVTYSDVFYSKEEITNEQIKELSDKINSFNSLPWYKRILTTKI